MEPSANARGPRPIAGTVRTLRRMLDLPEVDPLMAIEAGWESIVGARLAPSCTPQFVRDRVLVIAVHDAALGERLRWMSSAVVERVNGVCGASTIDGIVVRHRPV